MEKKRKRKGNMTSYVVDNLFSFLLIEEEVPYRFYNYKKEKE